jgi:hypothetical protein
MLKSGKVPKGNVMAEKSKLESVFEAIAIKPGYPKGKRWFAEGIWNDLVGASEASASADKPPKVGAVAGKYKTKPGPYRKKYSEAIGPKEPPTTKIGVTGGAGAQGYGRGREGNYQLGKNAKERSVYSGTRSDKPAVVEAKTETSKSGTPKTGAASDKSRVAGKMTAFQRMKARQYEKEGVGGRSMTRAAAQKKAASEKSGSLKMPSLGRLFAKRGKVTFAQPQKGATRSQVAAFRSKMQGRNK